MGRFEQGRWALCTLPDLTPVVRDPRGPRDLTPVVRVVRMVNNRANGYRQLDAFSDMIYLAAGDLDLPEQIPARFRTL